MLKKIISSKKFWWSVVLFTAEFIVFFNIVRIAVEYKFRFGAFYRDYFNAEVLPSFIVFNLIVGILFGFGTTFMRFWRQYKKQR